MEANKRLKKTRIELNFTQTQFAEMLNMKQGSYSDVERGRVGVSRKIALQLEKEFNVNSKWIAEGTGEMFLQGDTGNKNKETNKEAFYKKIEHSTNIKELYSFNFLPEESEDINTWTILFNNIYQKENERDLFQLYSKLNDLYNSRSFIELENSNLKKSVGQQEKTIERLDKIIDDKDKSIERLERENASLRGESFNKEAV